MIREAVKGDTGKLSEFGLQPINLENELFKVFVLEEDDTIKGCAAIKIMKNNDSEKCVIKSIAVDEKYRRNGVGKRLIDFLKSYAYKNGCDSVELDVAYDNYDAVDFFAVAGFKPQALNLIMDLK